MNKVPENKVREVLRYLRDGHSLRETAKLVGCSKGTVIAYRDIHLTDERILCPCGQAAGHRGWCSWRFGRSAKRQTWMRNFQSTRPRTARPPKKKIERLSLFYPFIVDQMVEGSDVLIRINSAVPKNLDPNMRADVCQELALAYFAGEIDLEDISVHVPNFIKRHYRTYPGKWSHVSLDAPVFGDNGRTLGEMIIG